MVGARNSKISHKKKNLRDGAVSEEGPCVRDMASYARCMQYAAAESMK
jgi:hypothetical protein